MSNTSQTYSTRLTLLGKVKDQYDERSWNEFVETYRRYIDAIICRMGISPSDSADVLQEVLLKLWKVIPSLELEKIKRFRSFLVSVTRNTVYDFVRKQAGRRGNRQEQFRQYQDGLDKMSYAEIEDIAELEWKKYVYNTALERVSSKLSAKAIAVFTASLEGRGIPDISKEMGIGVSTAFALKSRVKESLLEEVQAMNEFLG